MFQCILKRASIYSDNLLSAVEDRTVVKVPVRCSRTHTESLTVSFTHREQIPCLSNSMNVYLPMGSEPLSTGLDLDLRSVEGDRYHTSTTVF